MLNQFNEYLLGNLKNPFRENTIENLIEKSENQQKIKQNLKNIKYITS